MSGFQLRAASKVQLKARVALVGPSGSGKTYTGLEAALALAGDITKVAVIDTERGSAALYADEFGEFLHGVIDPPFTPTRYLEALEACAAAGAEVVIIDSLSHAWSGQGGVLEIVDNASARSRGNSFAAWREGTPEQNRLVDTVMRYPGHIIVTMRAKTEYIIEEDDRGKKVPRKIGLAPEQRKGMEYEFDLVADIDHDHRLMVSKSRCAQLQDAVERKPDRAWWGPFAEWLNRGDTVQQQAGARLAGLGFDEGQQAFVLGRYQDGASQASQLTGVNAGKLLSHLDDPEAVARIRAAVLGGPDGDGGATPPSDDPDGGGDGGEAVPPPEDRAQRAAEAVTAAVEEDQAPAPEPEPAEELTPAEQDRRKFFAILKDEGLDYDTLVKPWIVDTYGVSVSQLAGNPEMAELLSKLDKPTKRAKFRVLLEEHADARSSDGEPTAAKDGPFDWRAAAAAAGVHLTDVLRELRKDWVTSVPGGPQPNRTADIDRLVEADPITADQVRVLIADLASAKAGAA